MAERHAQRQHELPRGRGRLSDVAVLGRRHLDVERRRSHMLSPEPSVASTAPATPVAGPDLLRHLLRDCDIKLLV